MLGAPSCGRALYRSRKIDLELRLSWRFRARPSRTAPFCQRGRATHDASRRRGIRSVAGPPLIVDVVRLGALGVSARCSWAFALLRRIVVFFMLFEVLRVSA